MKHLLTALVSVASLLPAQTDGPPPDPLLHWLDRIAQQQLDQRERAIAAIREKAAADRRREFVRAKLLELLGGLPAYNGPLNARRTGQIPDDGYTIDKVLFESLPGFHVSGNLYRPNQPGRYPGVLVPAG